MKKILAAALLAVPTPAWAIGIDVTSATWTPSSTTKSTGSGTIGGTTITIGTAAVNNGGQTFGQNWAAMPFVINAGINSVSSTSTIILGFAGNATTPELVQFGSSLVDPYLFVNWTDPNTSFVFPVVPTTFSGSLATISGNVVTSTGTNGPNDGFMVGFTGTFNSLSFNVMRSGPSDTVGFTVGKVTSTPIPEPSTWCLGVAGIVLLGIIAKRNS